MGFVVGLVIGIFIGAAFIILIRDFKSFTREEEPASLFTMKIKLERSHEKQKFAGFEAVEICEKFHLDKNKLPKDGEGLTIDGYPSSTGYVKQFVPEDLARHLVKLFHDTFNCEIEVPLKCFIPGDLEIYDNCWKEKSIRVKKLSEERLRALIATYEMIRGNK